MSEVSRKVESTGGVYLTSKPSSLHAQTSLPPLSTWASADPFWVPMAGPLVLYSRITVPTAPWEMNFVFESAGCARFTCRIRPLFKHPLIPPPLPPLHHRHGKKKDELSARAGANGYQRDTHREKHSHRDQNKHVDKVKRNQNVALDRYVL